MSTLNIFITLLKTMHFVTKKETHKILDEVYITYLLREQEISDNNINIRSFVLKNSS